MNNSPLVPTPTVDKNGRQTTVYRRAEISSQAAGIPAPRVHGVRVPVSEEMVNTISDILMFESNHDVNELRSTLQKLSPTFRETLATVLEDEDYNFVTSVAANLNYENTETFLNEYIRFVREAGIDNLGYAGVMVRALHHYDYSLLGDHRDLTKAPNEVQDACSRLLRVTAALDRQYEPSMASLKYVQFAGGEEGPIIADTKLAETVVNDPATADKILEIIERHRVHEANAIFGILEGIEPSLAEGSL